MKKIYINKYKVISFDIFDTLIVRDVKDPTDVYQIIASSVLEKDGNCFRKDRIEAEKLARISNGGEVNLEQIYNFLEKKYEQFKQKLMEEEINYEIFHCRSRKRMHNVLNYAVSKGKRVVLISDMYLSSEVIKKMLERCGYNTANFEVYVSNEYSVDKKSGKLFEIVVDKLGIVAKDMIHLGDSIYADVLGAHKSGIRSIWIPKEKLFSRYFHKFIKTMYGRHR